MKRLDDMPMADAHRGSRKKSKLRELAAFHGIQCGYLSMDGRQCDASEEVLLCLLNSLGVKIQRAEQAEILLYAMRIAAINRGLEPVLVQWEGQRAKFRLYIKRSDKLLRAEVRLESGATRAVSPRALPPTAQHQVGKDIFLEQEFILPRLSLGYHRLFVEYGPKASESMLIVAPVRSYTNPALNGSWGIFAPMYAVHNQASWGAGGFAEYRKLMKWVGSNKGKLAGTLPLLASVLDKPACDPSPYAPDSRLFWNDFYIDIAGIPELAHCEPAQRLLRCATFQERLAKLRQEPMVNYREQAAAKRAVLEVLAEYFFSKPSQRRDQFDKFLWSRPELETYAAFRSVCDQRKTSWKNWPGRLRNGKLKRGDYSEETHRYYCYSQWIAHQQLTELVGSGEKCGVQMYLDLPLGVSPDGFDAWRRRDLFIGNARAGAPPDPCFPKGQDWGFAPLHPQRLRETHYSYVLDYLRFQMRQTGLLRIDHVMCLHRLYCIPEGMPASHGGYVSYPSEELHAIFNLESHRQKCGLIGENLGTVPPQVNEAMDRHGLRQMYVLQYEQHADASRPLRSPPAQSIASLNTHDMPPFAAHWAGTDIKERAELGLLPKTSVRPDALQRRTQNDALLQFLRRERLLARADPDAPAIARAALKWLARSPAEMILVNLEDLWGETFSQNIPGTLDRPNWRRKLRCSLEEMMNNPDFARFFNEVTKLRKSGKGKGGASP